MSLVVEPASRSLVVQVISTESCPLAASSVELVLTGGGSAAATLVAQAAVLVRALALVQLPTCGRV